MRKGFPRTCPHPVKNPSAKVLHSFASYGYIAYIEWEGKEKIIQPKPMFPPDCGNCYHLSPVAIAGVVLGDLLLTLLIAVAVYYVATCVCQRQQASSDYQHLHR
ncbi:UNVERIFIED_CONTAM: hypothetical protein K2H54_040546 [Gekko kuhli]